MRACIWIKNPFNLKNTLKMHEKCSHCGLIYQPSFFYGAMYVSYTNVATGIAAFLVHLIFGSTLKQHYCNNNNINCLVPLCTKMARNIYINMFVTYDPNGDKK
jgi:hypothetical protein